MNYKHAGLMAAFCCALANIPALAAVTAEEAALLKSTLTPFGAEKAGNKDGSIPPWDGGYTKSIPGYKPGGTRSDSPFSSEKPLFSINSKNVAQYADKLTEGQLALFKKYADYRIDVYPTHRTASAPQWVYDNTFKNATHAKTTSNDGYSIENAIGGIPFPIPKTGAEAMWNHQLMWQGEAWKWDFATYVTSADGKRFLTTDAVSNTNAPYYFKGNSTPNNKGDFLQIRFWTNGPAQKAGEQTVARYPLDQAGVGTQFWQYLVGQRRVRKLPNASYDTPNFVASGAQNFDEVFVWLGPMDRYDWKLLGKKELFIPYNNNGFLGPKTDAVLGKHFMNPDHVRWELHRVWVVEANLVAGKRHVVPKRRFYLDEDTWLSSLAEGWDAKGQLWRSFFYLNALAPDLPGVVPTTYGQYDLLTGEWYTGVIFNDKPAQIEFMKPWPASHFTPDAMAGEGIR